MCQSIGSALVQIMACRLCGTKPLPKPMPGYCQLDPKEQTSVKLLSKFKHFIHENASENIVCEMASILFRGRWVNAEMVPNLGLLVLTQAVQYTLRRRLMQYATLDYVMHSVTYASCKHGIKHCFTTITHCPLSDILMGYFKKDVTPVH